MFNYDLGSLDEGLINNFLWKPQISLKSKCSQFLPVAQN